MGYMQAISRERKVKLTRYFEKHPCVAITAETLCERALGGEVKATALQNWIRTHKDLFPYLEISHGGKYAGYMWQPPKQTEMVETETPGKNHEGYSDPTAAKAIKAVSAKVKAGEVWKIETRLGAEEFVLVLGFDDTRVACVRLFVSKRDDWKRAIRVMCRDKYYYGDISELTYRYLSAMRSCVATLTDEELLFVRKGVARYLGIDILVERVEVPKEVKKIEYVTQQVDRPELVKRAKEAEARVAELTEQHDEDCEKIARLESRVKELETKIAESIMTAGLPPVPTTDLLVAQAKLKIYEDLFDRLHPRKETKDEAE